MTEADRVRAWRDKKRGRPPRPYHRKRQMPLLKNSRAEGQRLAWLNPEIRKRRNAAIRKAWDDPLRRAIERARNPTQPGSKRSSRKAFNEYYRQYRRKKRDG